MATSTLQQALDALLGEKDGLEILVRRCRSEGTSWRRIVIDVYDRTGIVISHEALRSWYGDEPVEASA